MSLRSRERVAAILACRGDGCVAYDALRAQRVFEVIEGPRLPAEWRDYLREGEFRYLTLDPGPGDRERFGRYLPGLPPEAEVSGWGVGRVALKSVEGWHAGHRYWHPWPVSKPRPAWTPTPSRTSPPCAPSRRSDAT